SQFTQANGGQLPEWRSCTEISGQLQRVLDVLQTKSYREDDVLPRIVSHHAAGVAYDLWARSLARKDRLRDGPQVQPRALRKRKTFGAGCDLHGSDHVDDEFVGRAGTDGAESDDAIRDGVEQWAGTIHMSFIRANQQCQCASGRVGRQSGY